MHKAPLRLLIVAEIGTDELNGDVAIEEWLSSLIDDAHAAVAEKLGHFKIGQSSRQLLRCRRHERAWGKVGSPFSLLRSGSHCSC